LFLSVLESLAGETGKIAGKITDNSSGGPLPGANLLIIGTTLGSVADVKGEYFIINVPPGTHELRASYIGYKTELRTSVKVLVDKTTVVDFQLNSQAVKGEEVTVMAYRPDRVESDVTATKITYDIGQITSLPGITDISDVVSLQADVVDGHFRGGREGEAIYLISGAKIMNPLTGGATFVPITLGLEQVEVYTSGFSAEYGNVQSGVVNMVTKEGGTKWKTKIDFSTTNAHEQAWAGGIYSNENNPFYNILFNVNEWADAKDPMNGRPLYEFGAVGWDSYVPKQGQGFPAPPPPSRGDTLRTAALIRAYWLQGFRQIGLNTASSDRRIEFSTGGPLSEKFSVFVASRFRNNQPFIPTPFRDRDLQIMSNLAYRLNPQNKIKLEYNFNHAFRNDIASDFLQWFETVVSVQKAVDETQQIGVSWNHVFSPSMFMDLKANHLWTVAADHAELMAEGEYSDVYEVQSNQRTFNAPSGHQIGNLSNIGGTGTRTKTSNLQGNLTAQIDKRNLLKSGLQFYYYDMRVDNVTSVDNARSQRWQSYAAFPFEGAFYIQDKMEYQGFIANIGLRYDFYNFNTVYYTNRFSPYRNPDYDPTEPAAGAFYDANLSHKAKSKIETVFEPRIGFSFPVSDKTVLHLNYGVFSQRPPFQYIFVSRYKNDAIPNFDQMGNAELRPERTIAYDMGVVRVMPGGFLLGLGAYYKNVTNLLQEAQYVDKDGFIYNTYDNREYANVRGFHVNLDRNLGFLRGSIRYNWEAVKGKSSSATGAADQVAHYEGQPEKDQLRDPKDIYLDFNRLHKLIANVVLRTSPKAGFKVFGFYPLANFSISGNYRFLSGRPFTWDRSGQGLRFNQRTPNEHHTTLRLEKDVKITGTNVKIYGEVYNLLNLKIWDYGRTFSEHVDNLYRARYMEDAANLPAEDKKVMTEIEFTPYVTGLQPYLLDNSPRYFRLGMSFDF
jgi:outer membrane receptor for ferrienterochelin and colicin